MIKKKMKSEKEGRIRDSKKENEKEEVTTMSRRRRRRKGCGTNGFEVVRDSRAMRK